VSVVVSDSIGHLEEKVHLNMCLIYTEVGIFESADIKALWM
jgi:hypothetical protein